MVADAVYQPQYTEELSFFSQKLRDRNQQEEKPSGVRRAQNYYQSFPPQAHQRAST